MLSGLNHRLTSAYANVLRAVAGGRRPRGVETGPRILCLTRGGISDMLLTLSLFHALRRHFPTAQLTVACDAGSGAIALACEAVNDVIVLETNWNAWTAAYKNAARLHDHDWVIASHAGLNRQLGLLTRFTNGSIRIGFDRHADRSSAYFTDPVALPADANDEHQIETLLRLLKPVGLVKSTAQSVNLDLHVPDASRDFAFETLAGPPFVAARQFMLINLSSTVPVKFREQDFIALSRQILGSTDLAIGLISTPADQQRVHEIAFCMGSPRIIAVEVPTPLDLAALLQKASFLLTPEADAAHLAAAVGTPALVLWSGNSFKKCHSRGRKHEFVHAQTGEATIPLERVWQALQPFLMPKINDIEKQWADLMQQPPASDLQPD